MDSKVLVSTIVNLVDEGQFIQAQALVELALENAANKALSTRPPKEDLSAAYDNLATRLEEQIALNEELVREPIPITDWGIQALYLGEGFEECLEAVGIYTLGDLCKVDKNWLYGCYGIGTKAIENIERSLAKWGLRLAEITTSPGATKS